MQYMHLDYNYVQVHYATEAADLSNRRTSRFEGVVVSREFIMTESTYSRLCYGQHY